MVQPGPADPTSQLIQGISELVTNDPAAGPGLLGIVSKAAVIIQDGHIAWVGPEASAPAADTAIDLQGRAVLPGWVDSHTHLISAHDRVDDFTAQVSGTPATGNALQIMVDATRAAEDPDLLAVARWHRGEMLTGGTTCAETKTGYGLTVRDEARLAATAQTAGFDEITFHGAYAVPPEYRKAPTGTWTWSADPCWTRPHPWSGGSACPATTAWTVRRSGGCWPPGNARASACECRATKPAPGRRR